MSTISASTTSTTAYKVTADTTGTLVLQTGSTPTTAVTIDTAQNLGLGVTPPATMEASSGIAMGTGLGTTSAMYTKRGYLNNAFYDGTNYKYINSTYASQFIQYNGQFIWSNATSGTAGGTVSFTQAMTLDASGNLGVNTSSPQGKLDVRAGTGATIFVANDATNLVSINNYNPTSGFQSLKFVGSTLQFFTGTAGGGSAAESGRFDSSGNLLIGATSVPAAGSGGSGFYVDSNGRRGLAMSTTSTAANTLVAFMNPNGTVGSINTSGSLTAYNVSSDYRLKENIVPLTGALEKIAQLKPSLYNYKADPTTNIEGFIAHELQTVVPHAVTGEKDAVDEEGNPIYQGVDASFLIPFLTAAIQEQQAIIETLTNRINALEAK